MDSEQGKITPSEKTKLYLTKKLSEIEIKLKRMKKKKIIIQTIHSKAEDSTWNPYAFFELSTRWNA